MNVTVTLPDDVWGRLATHADEQGLRVRDMVADALFQLSVDATVLHKSDVDMAAFLVDVSHYAIVHPLRIPKAEKEIRAYDRETEKLRKFLSGRQSTTNPKESNT